jgi:hypothetical protein
MPDLSEGILLAILAAVSAVIGAFVRPEVGWNIEKRRQRMQERREKIARWREWLGQRPEHSDLNDSQTYTELRPYLRARTRSTCEGGPIRLVMGRGGNAAENEILEDIHRLEHRWGLVGSPVAFWVKEFFAILGRIAWKVLPIPARRVVTRWRGEEGVEMLIVRSGITRRK